MTQEIIVTVKHIRAANLCARGARQWFTARNLDYNEFLLRGLPISQIDAVDDALAKLVTNAARLDAAGEL